MNRKTLLITSTITIISLLILWCTTIRLIVPIQNEQSKRNSIGGNQITFDLKHIYHNNPNKHHGRLDVDLMSINDIQIQQKYSMKCKPSLIKRLSDRVPDHIESYLVHSLSHPEIDTYSSLDWTVDEILVPNITDASSVLQLARMASNAYARLPIDPSWRDVRDPNNGIGKGFNSTEGFGWLKSGVRGHVFVENIDDDYTNRKPLIIIAIKGTTAAGLGGGNGGGDDGNGGKTGDDGQTVEEDKVNDNLLFSCCCARVSSLWSTVCDCYEKAYTCNQNCLEGSLRRPDRYYKATLDIYRNISQLYPGSEVWVTGHSLGGALGSLLGRTYGLPAVTFESPGEMLATKRLHLPLPPGLPVDLEHIWHFGNNADPIFMGVCNGASSSCSIAGYAMESACHSGMKCTYDTITKYGWHVSMLNHRLKTVIDKVLALSNETAECVKPPPCIDCYNWKFVDHGGDKYKWRTQRPTTTSTAITSSSLSKPPNRKCIKWTWYGSCSKWEGDDDDNESQKTTLITQTVSHSHLISRSGIVTEPKTTPRPTMIISSSTTQQHTKCAGYNWFGGCTKWE